MSMPVEHLLISVRSPENGQLGTRRVASMFGKTIRELAQTLGRDPCGLGKHPTSDTLRAVFADLGVGRMWLRAPTPILGGRASTASLLEQRRVTVRRLAIYRSAPVSLYRR